MEENSDIQEQYDQWENNLKRILDTTFTSKRRKPLASGEMKEVRQKMKQVRAKKKQRRDNRRIGISDNTEIEAEIKDLQYEISNRITEMCQELEEKIEEIEKTGGAASNQIWKLHKALKTNSKDEGHTIKDPTTGERTCEPEEIKKCYTDYFRTLLSTNEKKKDMKKYTI